MLYNNSIVVTCLVMSGILSTKSPKNITFSYTLPNSEEEMGSEVKHCCKQFSGIVQCQVNLLVSPGPEEMVDQENSLGLSTLSKNPEQPAVQQLA